MRFIKKGYLKKQNTLNYELRKGETLHCKKSICILPTFENITFTPLRSELFKNHFGMYSLIMASASLTMGFEALFNSNSNNIYCDKRQS